jgi:hypothetical protein
LTSNAIAGAGFEQDGGGRKRLRGERGEAGRV